MRRATALAALAALFLSGCYHWIRWPHHSPPFPDGPTRTSRPSHEPVHPPQDGSDSRTASDDPR